MFFLRDLFEDRLLYNFSLFQKSLVISHHHTDQNHKTPEPNRLNRNWISYSYAVCLLSHDVISIASTANQSHLTEIAFVCV